MVQAGNLQSRVRAPPLPRHSKQTGDMKTWPPEKCVKKLNKKTKWSECPEAQPGVCRAATVNNSPGVRVFVTSLSPLPRHGAVSSAAERHTG